MVAGVIAKGNLDINPDSIRTTSFWTIASPSEDFNLPAAYGVFMSFLTGGAYPALQVIYERSSAKVWHRTADANWVWNEWL